MSLLAKTSAHTVFRRDCRDGCRDCRFFVGTVGTLDLRRLLKSVPTVPTVPMVTKYRYTLLETLKYCGDYVYLPEGSYPALLNVGDELYDSDRKQECLNRCLDAYGENPSTIGYQAFYVKAHGDDRCACAVGDCR